jgi:hypothetical protein
MSTFVRANLGELKGSFPRERCGIGTAENISEIKSGIVNPHRSVVRLVFPGRSAPNRVLGFNGQGSTCRAKTGDNSTVVG